MGGRLLGVGGHMHDYGVRVRLEDVETGKVLIAVTATRDSAGKVSKMSRKLFGVSGEGMKLKGNHRYRVVGEYDNPTGETLVKGAMAHMAGLFTPDDMSRWPAIDPSDPGLPARPGVAPGAGHGGRWSPARSHRAAQRARRWRQGEEHADGHADAHGEH